MVWESLNGKMELQKYGNGVRLQMVSGKVGFKATDGEKKDKTKRRKNGGVNSLEAMNMVLRFRKWVW